MARLGGINARDIRVLMEAGGIDPRIGQTMIGLAERQDHLFHLLEQVAHAMDTMASSLLAQTSAVGDLQKRHAQLKEAKSLGIKVESEAQDDTPT